MAKILCMDSESDNTTKAVADWRKKNLYPQLQGNGHTFSSLNGNMAVRAYLKQDLAAPNVSFFSGSGHGLPDEFQGTDGYAALKVKNYERKEVEKKIIHLLSCETAQVLGSDTVVNGCSAFFGYDFPFTFRHSFIDHFLKPDAVLVKSLVAGLTAKEAFKALDQEYEISIKNLENSGADEYTVADMETNRSHFMGPHNDGRWGDVNARIQ